MVQAWRCDRDACGHVWLSPGKPKRCAKCKSPAWDRGAPAVVDPVELVARVVPIAVPVAPAISRRVEVDETEVSLMCPYTEYDGETGETYRCGLAAHSFKVKHTRGPAV